MGILGKFVWYDLLTPAPDQAQEFYKALLPWGTQQWDGKMEGKPPYTMWTNAGNPMGGVMDLPEEAAKMGAPPHWIAYIGTPDVNASTEKAQGLGATAYVPPTDVPDVGRFAILADPQGAVFALFTPKNEPPGDAPEGTPGVFSWHELAAENVDEAWNFYAQLFEWQRTEAHDMGAEMGVYQMFGVGGETCGGLFKRPKEMPVSAWLQYITVSDLDASVAKLKSLGGQVLNGPMEVPGGDRVCQCMDPQGAAFALHEPKG